MEKPSPILGRMLFEGDLGPFCPKCKSSLKKKWWFFRTTKCIHPDCPNTGKINETKGKE